jgi:hypothetical protein
MFPTPPIKHIDSAMVATSGYSFAVLSEGYLHRYCSYWCTGLKCMYMGAIVQLV